MQNRYLLSALFLLSLLGNAFLVGLIAGHGPRPEFRGPPHPQPPMMRIQHAARDLPDEQRKIVNEVLARRQLPDERDIGPLFGQLETVLTAPAFDRKALEKIHADIARQDRALKSSMEAIATELAERLTPEARIELFRKIFQDHHGKKFKNFAKDATEFDAPPVE